MMTLARASVASDKQHRIWATPSSLHTGLQRQPGRALLALGSLLLGLLRLTDVLLSQMPSAIV